MTRFQGSYKATLHPLCESLHPFDPSVFTLSAILLSIQKKYDYLNQLFNYTILSTTYTASQPHQYQQPIRSLSLFRMPLHSFLSKANCHSDSLPRYN